MWNDTDTPLAYFISFRTYATWLHGDQRGSIDRYHNRYRSPYLPANREWQKYIQQQLRANPFKLNARHRVSVEGSIREACRIRKWQLEAVNVRTNHVHTVVAAGQKKAAVVLNALKANATRQLRKDGLWDHSFSPWAAKGSKRRLWNERSVARAVDYTLNGQGEDLPDFDE
jgi:REP element-mobilizing transposase RayT